MGSSVDGQSRISTHSLDAGLEHLVLGSNLRHASQALLPSGDGRWIYHVRGLRCLSRGDGATLRSATQTGIGRWLDAQSRVLRDGGRVVDLDGGYILKRTVEV